MVQIRNSIAWQYSAHQVVVWGMPEDAGHWEELRLDRIRSVRDSELKTREIGLGGRKGLDWMKLAGIIQ